MDVPNSSPNTVGATAVVTVAKVETSDMNSMWDVIYQLLMDKLSRKLGIVLLVLFLAGYAILNKIQVDNVYIIVLGVIVSIYLICQTVLDTYTKS